MPLFFPILSSVTKSSSMHLALGGTMPDGLPPSATKHVGGVGASRTVSSNENRQEREKVRDSYSWRLLRFLEVCFLFYLPSGCLWVCVYMYVYDSISTVP